MRRFGTQEATYLWNPATQVAASARKTIASLPIVASQPRPNNNNIKTD